MNMIALVLIVLTSITGAIVLVDKLFFAKNRNRAADKETKLPFIIETGYSFFPVLLIVLVVRSFIFEPFRIPSGSMLPTLYIGDFIAVNKMSYGLRWPLSNEKFLDLGSPQRGDVAVFQYPKDKSVDYIKRVIGVPGDTVAYRNKTLFINGEKQVQTPTEQIQMYKGFVQFTEQLGEVRHEILDDGNNLMRGRALPALYRTGVTVPQGQYLMMGDNRDRSADSRSWGFAAEENMRGKAILIWMHFNWNDFSFEYKRIGSLID